MGRTITFGEVVGEAKMLVGRHGGLLVAVGAAITALYVGLDWMTTQNADAGGLTLLTLVVGLAISLFVQYLVVEEMLADRLAPGQPKGDRRFLSMFGAMFLAGLGIVAGLILLIIPGLYIAARWFTMAQQIVERRLPATEALNASWESSGRSQGAFIAAYLVGAVPTLLALPFGFMAILDEQEANYWVAVLIINLLSALSFVASWVLATAAHRLAEPTDHVVQKVFD